MKLVNIPSPTIAPASRQAAQIAGQLREARKPATVQEEQQAVPVDDVPAILDERDRGVVDLRGGPHPTFVSSTKKVRLVRTALLVTGVILIILGTHFTSHSLFPSDPVIVQVDAEKPELGNRVKMLEQELSTARALAENRIKEKQTQLDGAGAQINELNSQLGVMREQITQLTATRAAGEKNISSELFDRDTLQAANLAFNQGNYTEALKLYRRSADTGSAVGQYRLGIMYENGNGIPRDFASARYWYNKAASQGYENAKAGLRRVSN